MIIAALAATTGSLPVAAAGVDQQPDPIPLSAYPEPRDALDDRCWSRTFNEEFRERSLFDAKSGQGRWTTHYLWGNDIVINEELQYYADPREHDLGTVVVENGVLTLAAIATPPALLEQAGGRPYISGLVTTADSFSQFQGRFEIRAKVPEGRGLWSAFWLLPTFDRWPEGVDILPEIDVMEHIGQTPATYHTTLHTNQSGELKSYPADHSLDKPLSDGFHLYSVVWNDEAVHWYLDRNWMASQPTPEDFQRPVHVLLNLAVGGTWPGSPDASTRFPARYQIDYVDAWQANGHCRGSG